MSIFNNGVAKEDILEALKQIVDPDLKKDVVTLGMIRDLDIRDGRVSFRFVLTTPACPVKDRFEGEARQIVSGLKGVKSVDIKMDSEVPRQKSVPERKAVEGVANIVAVTSGKGGVGKSTVAVNLACALAREGAKVGLIDCDIYGPNVPIMMGNNDQLKGRGDMIIPLESHGVKFMSMGLLARDDTPLVWRGPMLHNVLQKMLYQVEWGKLDYLIADLPPGTGDVQITMTQSVPLSGGIIVTTPQDVALSDARKGVVMLQQVNVDVLGIIENMSYFVCPACGERSEIFDHGGGEATSREFNVPFLGGIPLETGIRKCGDRGIPLVVEDPDSPAAVAFAEIARTLAAEVSKTNLQVLDSRD